jgi:hypothetical protein
MEEAAKEAQKMKGVPLRTETYMVLLPAGLEFDRTAAIEGKADSSTGEAAKGALGGMLRGRLGVRSDKDAAPEEQKPRQTTFVKMISETTDIRTTSLSADLFSPPAGYTEKPLQLPTGVGQE